MQTSQERLPSADDDGHEWLPGYAGQNNNRTQRDDVPGGFENNERRLVRSAAEAFRAGLQNGRFATVWDHQLAETGTGIS